MGGVVMICPYCNQEMKEGIIEADGRKSVIWVEKNKKRGLISKIMKKDCIVLDKASVINCEVTSHYCNNCEKIIINRKELQ